LRVREARRKELLPVVQHCAVVLALVVLSGNVGCASDHGGKGRDSQASHPGDSGAPDDKPRPLALPTDIASLSAASAGKSEHFQLFLGVGAPEPYGRGESSRYKLRMGVRSPQ
jgi:hypothetical protein